MGNVCIKSDVDEFAEFKKKLKHLNIPSRRVSDNGEQHQPRKKMSIDEFRQHFVTEGSPYH